MKKILSVAVATIITASSLAADVTKELKLASEVNWTFLNPKRGNLAPSAGDLWGDRTTKSAAGV